MNNIYILILIILIFYEGCYKIKEYMDISYQKSTLDNRNYSISKSFDDKQLASDTLSKLHSFICTFLDYIKSKYLNQPSLISKDKKEFIKRILNNYNPDTLYENNPYNGKETSFVINKGDKFGVCLREKITETPNKIHMINTLQFVVLHEITHIGTIQYGHGDEFWQRFKFLLIEAEQSGLYHPINYKKFPVNYCGLSVSSNPYFDKVLKY